MKRLLLLLALYLILAAPVMGTALTFQNVADTTVTTPNAWVPNTTGGNSYIIPYNFNIIKTPIGSAFVYAGITALTSTNGFNTIYLYDSSGNLIYTYGNIVTTDTGRWEVKVVGGQANVYLNGILRGTSGALAVNPSQLGLYGGAATQWDDLVLGSTDSKYVVGMPETNAYFIKKDMVAPAVSGLYNYTTGALVNSQYMTTTWGRSNLSDGGDVNESLYLINVDSGTIYDTKYTMNASTGTTNWNIATSLIAADAPYGRYQIKFGDFYSEHIAYIADGAEINFNAASYRQQDTATITYNIDGAYWDTSTYAYTMKIYSANDWSVVSNQPISAMSGTFTYQFTSSNPQGEYYAVIIATPNSGGNDIWMNYDYAALIAYAKFTGWVNGENGLPISGANVSFSQNSIVANSITIADGNYSADGFLTGATLVINTTKSGYSQYYVSFNPMVAKSISLNITLNSTTPTYTGLGIGGVARDGILTGSTITGGYGRPISGATCYLRNQSNGESCTNVTNMAAWYKFDEGNGCVLTTKRLYDVWCSRLGYSTSANYTVVAA